MQIAADLAGVFSAPNFTQHSGLHLVECLQI